MNLMESKEIKDLLEYDYGIQLDIRKDGSFAMVDRDHQGQNFLFLSSQLALERFNEQGKTSSRSEIVFNSPITLYSYLPVVEALMKEGIVSEADGIYTVDMGKLADEMVAETTWADIGLTDIYGPISIDTTDPNQSNSGNMFLGLLANAINGGTIQNQDQLAQVIPEIQNIYNQMGYMQTSSADMFNQFLRQGMGSFPIIAGYENQLLEFSLQHGETYQQVKDDIIILYPTPTVWSSHVVIALDETSDILIDAMLDPEAQRMAWENHGFRTVVAGTADTQQFNVDGVAETIPSVIDMPSWTIMQELMHAIQ